ncbi:MAG TPA: hypothetical protein VLM85_04585 [Polyangiaceae bacterium]|nr:hypothetical protein [Polyangiaceae bacterium]
MNIKNCKSTTVLAIVGMAVAGGCSSATQPLPGESNVTITSVAMNADGSQSVRQYEITQAQYTAMASARSAQQTAARGETPTPVHMAGPMAPAPTNNDSNGVGQQAQATITEDVCTDGNALWIYDQASCPSSPDYMLCLIGSGTNVSLHNWYSLIQKPFPPGGFTYAYWDTRVYSFWPGNDGGAMLDNAINETQFFSAGQSCTTAAMIDRMDAVTLN